ncbi:MAG: nitroreductase family protein [Candidatus Bathyarchaeota archaeon]|nr:nitroreductase family protein [Candidatus Bathyarchaeota archaeon]
MSCIDFFLNRRTIRKYSDKPIPEKVQHTILEAGRRAASAVNRQPWHFIIVEDQGLKTKLAETGRWRSFIKESAFTVVGCHVTDDEVSRRWGQVDVVIAMQSMSLAAEVQGVGSCWIGDYEDKEISETLGVPEGVKVVGLMSFGYPDEEPAQRPKKPAEEIFHYNKW